VEPASGTYKHLTPTAQRYVRRMFPCLDGGAAHKHSSAI
jgi:hypothetical protein